MHKGLKLHIRPASDGTDIAERQLPGKNNPVGTHLLKKSCSILPGDGHLCRSMQRQIRKPFLQRSENTQILYQHRIDPPLIEGSDVRIQLLPKLSFLEQRIDSQIHSDAVEMAEIDGFQKPALIRILRICARTEQTAARIDRICSCRHRGFYPRQTSTRGEKLYLRQSPASFLLCISAFCGSSCCSFRTGSESFPEPSGACFPGPSLPGQMSLHDRFQHPPPLPIPRMMRPHARHCQV